MIFGKLCIYKSHIFRVLCLHDKPCLLAVLTLFHHTTSILSFVSSKVRKATMIRVTKLRGRLLSTRAMNEASTSSGNVANPLIQKALKPIVYSNPKQLTQFLRRNVLAHAPGRFVVIPKPFGVSCMGYADKDGGIFGSGVKDERKTKKWMQNVKEKSTKKDGVTIGDCIDELRTVLREPNLTFCTGLKRYLSGSIVLPCNEADKNILKTSIRQMSADSEPPFMYNALAITIGQPDKEKGQISGFATFRNVGKHKEYIFEERSAKKRAKAGKYAVEGCMSWQVIDSNNGCSLIEFSVNKFARHLPRLMLSELVSPILGDIIYWRRLSNVNGKAELITAGDKGHNIFVPKELKEILEIHSWKQIMEQMPIYCHVYRTVFDNVGGHEEHGLVAASKPPAHFMAMLELLGLTAAYRNFKKETRRMDEDDGKLPTSRNSGEKRF